uniref:Uncharacterized protein n=1 Tax=Cannabis sativa TaxID=3483 RepID=A0A803PRR1_CANSA
MEAMIQQHDEEIQRLKQQRSPVVPLPHMPLILDSVLLAEHGMAGNQVETLHERIWMHEHTVLQGDSNMKNALCTGSLKEFILKPQEVMIGGQDTTCHISIYGGGGRGFVVEKKRKPTSTVVGFKQNKQL